MKRNIIKTAVVIIFLGLCADVVLAESFTFSSVTAIGTGCPIGSTDTIKTPNGKAVSILFSEMMVEVPQYDGDNDNNEVSDTHRSPVSNFNSNISHKVCKIIINGQIPEGEKVESIDVSVDFRGYTSMEAGTQALFHSQMISWTGPKKVSRRAKDMIARKVWRFGDVDQDWLISNTKKIDIHSNCSKKGSKKIKFALRNVLKAGIRSGNEDANALVTLDSADFSGKLSLKINTKKCTINSDVDIQPPSRGGRIVKRCPRTYVFDRRQGICVSQRTGSRGRR